MDSVNASANILNDVFYSHDSGNEAGAASCTPIEVRGEKKQMIYRSQTLKGKGVKRKVKRN